MRPRVEVRPLQKGFREGADFGSVSGFAEFLKLKFPRYYKLLQKRFPPSCTASKEAAYKRSSCRWISVLRRRGGRAGRRRPPTRDPRIPTAATRSRPDRVPRGPKVPVLALSRATRPIRPRIGFADRLSSAYAFRPDLSAWSSRRLPRGRVSGRLFQDAVRQCLVPTGDLLATGYVQRGVNFECAWFSGLRHPADGPHKSAEDENQRRLRGPGPALREAEAAPSGSSRVHIAPLGPDVP